MDLKHALETAKTAADGASDIIRRYMGEKVKADTKGLNDFVTEADRASERRIKEIILNEFPDHHVMAEESGGERKGDRVWIIDPLDGTTNFIHGFPFFAISIALEVDGEPAAAVTADPLRDEVFTASAGSGAYLNGSPISVSEYSELSGSLIATGFPFRAHKRIPEFVPVFEKVLRNAAAVRRAGAAALDLAYVACGRADGFWEFGLSPWDVAAGALLIKEAGGVISDTSGGGDYLSGDVCAAGSDEIHRKLLGYMNE